MQVQVTFSVKSDILNLIKQNFSKMSCRSKICNPVQDQSGDWLANKVSPEVKEAVKELSLDNNALKKVMALFLDNIERGLKAETHDAAKVKCFPTYVQDLPDGTETGNYLALDLGGTNFRVLLVKLDGGKCDITSEVYTLSSELMTGTGDELFDYIAECLSTFVHKNQIEDQELSLGFTFSFPLVQKGLRSGILVRWTKGYNIPEVVGQDVVVKLNEAIARRGDIKIDVAAILNDTTGTLMSCAYEFPDCRVGVIIGTGHNGCYYESQANAELFDEPNTGSGKVIINLEGAAFGEDGCLDFVMTDIDKQIDREGMNPTLQVYEKLISGMYLGELVRHYALRVIEAGVLFRGGHADIFGERNIFTTEMISEVESDPMNTFSETTKVLQTIGVTDASEQDKINIRYICQAVSTRAAVLAAATCSTLVNKIKEPKIVIGIDGSLYKLHPHFKSIMKNKMLELANPAYKFDLELSHDGSGKGAALIAAKAAQKR